MLSTAREWLQRGAGLALPHEFVVGFDNYLSSLPWVGSSLDWARMDPPEIVNMADADSTSVSDWLSRTRIGRHSHIAIWYSSAEEGLVVPARVAIDNLDELYRFSPGVRYAFGVSVREGELIPAYADLIEYGRGDELRAVAAWKDVVSTD